MKTTLKLVPLFLLAGFIGSAPIRAAEKALLPAEMTNIKVIASGGEHNAFPVLVKWKDAYWLTYRKAVGHVGKGDLIMLRSTDGDAWTEVRRVDLGPDDRNAQWLATPNRLFLYHAVSKDPRGNDYQSYVEYTDDGKTWSEPQKSLEAHWIFWKPFEHNGKFYANAHLKAEGDDAAGKRFSKLITSTDGLKWDVVSTVREGKMESETTFYFDPKEHLYAFLRTKYSNIGSILESDPPYQTWTERSAGVHFSGHSVRTFRGVTYFFSRQFGKQSRTSMMIYTFADGKLTPYCQSPLNPAKGDCAYAEAVEIGDEMLVAFYSSHEGATNVYTGRVKLKK